MTSEEIERDLHRFCSYLNLYTREENEKELNLTTLNEN